LNTSVVLIGGAIYIDPMERPIPNGALLVIDGKIANVGTEALRNIPPDAETLDCPGMTITAGFWNSHVHFFERKWANAAEIPSSDLGRQLQDMLTRYGFTTVFDTGSSWENTRAMRDRVESVEVAGPRIYSTGEPLIARGALPSDIVMRMMGVMNIPVFEITEAAQAADAARRLLDAGVDAIKVHLQPPPPPNLRLPESAIEAAVNEAHRVDKPVFVHPNTGADVLAAARCGVDVIAHTTPHSGPWDGSTIAAMREARVALTPTLTLWKHYARHDRISTQDQIVNTELDQLRAWIGCGGDVLFGNDLGAVEYDPADEYILMMEAGMSFRRILTSLTTTPAERFAKSGRRGRIAAGEQADLVVLNGDPAADIRALANVQYTLRAGKRIYYRGGRFPHAGGVNGN
jgi:imidazolonepropionase-like amidohydrolase